MDASGTTRGGGGSDDWLPAAAEMVGGAFKMLTSTKTELPVSGVAGGVKNSDEWSGESFNTSPRVTRRGYWICNMNLFWRAQL